MPIYGCSWSWSRSRNDLQSRSRSRKINNFGSVTLLKIMQTISLLLQKLFRPETTNHKSKNMAGYRDLAFRLAGYPTKSLYGTSLKYSLNQCCGSGMIYSGSGSSFEFSEFRIRIQAKVPNTWGSGSNLN